MEGKEKGERRTAVHGKFERGIDSDDVCYMLVREGVVEVVWRGGEGRKKADRRDHQRQARSCIYRRQTEAVGSYICFCFVCLEVDWVGRP